MRLRYKAGAAQLEAHGSVFLLQLGVRPNERITAIADGAGEFETAIAESQYTDLRIVNWFHIAMKFRAAQLTAQGMNEQLPHD